MGIFFYQIFIFVAIYISSLFGKNSRNVAVILISIFTILQVFTSGLMILQFATIIFSYFITTNFILNDETEKTKNTEIEELKNLEVEKQINYSIKTEALTSSKEKIYISKNEDIKIDDKLIKITLTQIKTEEVFLNSKQKNDDEILDLIEEKIGDELMEKALKKRKKKLTKKFPFSSEKEILEILNEDVEMIAEEIIKRIRIAIYNKK